MDVVKTGQHTIALLDAVLNNKVIVVPEDIDWKDVFAFAQIHKVDNILGYITNNIQDINPGYAKLFADKMKASIVLDAMQDYIIEKVCSCFDNAQIRYVTLKGYELKKMYPTPDMRTMSDVDFFIEKKNFNQCRKILENSGFELVEYNTEEACYRVENNVYIEIHTVLIGEEYPEYNVYYSKIWDRLTNAENFRYKMSDEDFYIYHIVHMAKHYQYRGAGLRFVLDVHIFMNKFNDTLDWNYLNEELEKLRLVKFNEYVVELAEAWFGDGKINAVTAEMEKYVFSSGVHGNLLRGQIIKETKKIGIKKIRYYINEVFPSMKNMSARYPVLEAKRYLLPILWIHRIVKRMFNKNGSSSNCNITITDKQKQELIEHLNKVGIK